MRTKIVKATGKTVLNEFLAQREAVSTRKLVNKPGEEDCYRSFITSLWIIFLPYLEWLRILRNFPEFTDLTSV